MNYFSFIIGLIIGLGCFWVSFRLIRLYFTVQKWDRVEAKILSREIFLRPKYSYSRTPHGIKVEYEFLINGKKYTGTKMTITELMGGQVNYMKKDAEKRINKIAPIMQIYVNPANPNESVLYCKGIGLYIVVFMMGIVSCLLGLVSLVG